jgi:hypothetical protein
LIDKIALDDLAYHPVDSECNFLKNSMLKVGWNILIILRGFFDNKSYTKCQKYCYIFLRLGCNVISKKCF